ncbi:VTT domain-containing protein [Candidatus Gottesmanbacteria bacterium]|nr:VTT domain-containing protein [Candidatus Gottesmanbacteria bacterium]
MVSKKVKLEALGSLIIIIALFVIVSYTVRQNIGYFEETIGDNEFGIIIYFIFVVIETVVAPISSLPIIPLVAQVYGVIPTAIASWLAWIVGSIITFYLCRKYGVELVKKFVSMEEIHEFEELIIPKEHMFRNLVLLRIVAPMEILSYALGLFSRVDFKTYTITAMIGLIPAAFLLSYLGVVPLIYQLLVFSALILITILLYLLRQLFLVSKKAEGLVP